MRTDKKEYLADLYKLQNQNVPTVSVRLPKDEPFFEIDLNKRQIITDDKFEVLSAQYDHNAETVYFKTDRFYDNMDLTNTTCIITYINKNSKYEDGTPVGGFIYRVPFYDKMEFWEENKIVFPWVIEGPATAAAGPVEFGLMFYRLEEKSDKPGEYEFIYKLNIQPITKNVLYSMELGEEEMDSFINASKDFALQVEQQLKDFEDKLNNKTFWVEV